MNVCLWVLELSETGVKGGGGGGGQFGSMIACADDCVLVCLRIHLPI